MASQKQKRKTAKRGGQTKAQIRAAAKTEKKSGQLTKTERRRQSY